MKPRTVDKLMCNDAVRFSLRARRLLQRYLNIHVFVSILRRVRSSLFDPIYSSGQSTYKCISAFSSMTYESIEKDDYGC